MFANDLPELLAVGQSVAREKGLSKELLVDVMREAIPKLRTRAMVPMSIFALKSIKPKRK